MVVFVYQMHQICIRSRHLNASIADKLFHSHHPLAPPPVRQDSTSNPERRKTKIEDRKVAAPVLVSGVSWLIYLKGGVMAGF
jgi:hypothetical protein